MKVSKKKIGIHAASKSFNRLIIVDEFHQAFGSNMFNIGQSAFRGRAPNRMVATQAILTRNSGKRVRILGRTWMENGDWYKAPPNKFLPRQVTEKLKQHCSI